MKKCGLEIKRRRKRRPGRYLVPVFLTLLFFVQMIPVQAEEDRQEAAEEELMAQGPGVYYKAAGKTADSADSKIAGSELTENKSAENKNAESKNAESKNDQTADGQKIRLDPNWTYADFSVIHTGEAMLYKAKANRKNLTVAVNAGHGTKGGSSQKTYSHPDRTPKVTGGTTAAGAVKSTCVSAGMTFNDGTPEAAVTLQEAKLLKEKLLAAGYDVLMLRDGEDVQLDNVARTVIANNMADIHIALHWDSDGRKSIKGAFYMSVPDALKSMEPVKSVWQKSEALGDSLIRGLETKIPGIRIFSAGGHGQMDMDLTQTSYSTVPSVDIELGNQCSAHDTATLTHLADGLTEGIEIYFKK